MTWVAPGLCLQRHQVLLQLWQKWRLMTKGQTEQVSLSSLRGSPGEQQTRRVFPPKTRETCRHHAGRKSGAKALNQLGSNGNDSRSNDWAVFTWQ